MNVMYQDPLRIALAPIWDMLSDPLTEDVAFNAPGLAWWFKEGRWSPVEVPEMTYRRLHGVAVLAASQARQRIDGRHPILSADLPSGHRLQVLMPPAVPEKSISLTFRRHTESVSPLAEISARFQTGRWNKWTGRQARIDANTGAILERYDAGDIYGFLQASAQTRRTGLFGGQTGAGKTFLLKSYLSSFPLDARMLVIEDAREAVIIQPNHVRLIYSSGALSGSALSQTALLKSALRMRPDFVTLGEIRDPEASWTLLNEVMAGHPGSPGTLHGRDAGSMARRLFQLVKGSDEGRMIGDETLIDMLCSAIDMLVPISNIGGIRSIEEVWFVDDAARRGETFRDLLRSA